MNVGRIFGSVFSRSDQTIEESISVIQQALADIEPVLDLATNGGWLQIEKALIRLVDLLEQEIILLCDNPKKNEAALIQLKAQRDAYIGVVLTVREPQIRVKTVRKELEKRLNLLRETSGLPRPSELETSQP